MDYIKKKFVDKEDRFISFFSTDDNIICSNGKTLRDNMEMINNPSEEVCDINYISPESLDEFVELTKEGGLFYCLTNIPIVYNEKNYDVVGLIDVRPHSNGINYYAYNKMWQFLINPDTKALVSFSSFAEFLQNKIPSDASKLNIIDVNDNFTSENIEGALEELNTQVEENQINLLEDETSMEGISDTEYPTLTTQNKTLIGSINEVNTQYKDLVNIKADKNDLQVQKARIDNFTSLQEGNTTGDAELIDGRIGVDGVTYPNIGDAIRTQINNIKKQTETISCNIDSWIVAGLYMGGIVTGTTTRITTNEIHYFENDFTIETNNGYLIAIAQYSNSLESSFISQSSSWQTGSIACKKGYYRFMIRDEAGTTPGDLAWANNVKFYTQNKIYFESKDKSIDYTKVTFIDKRLNKNLAYLEDKTINATGWSFSLINQEFTLTRTGTVNQNGLKNIDILIDLKAGTYTFSSANENFTSNIGYLHLYKNDTKLCTIQPAGGISNATFTLDADATVLLKYDLLCDGFNEAIDNNSNIKFNIQIEEGITATEYVTSQYNLFLADNINLGNNSNIYQLNNLYGKIWNALGDSLTAGLGASHPYHNIIASRNYMSVNNYGISGTTIAKSDVSNPMCERYINMDDNADIITVFGGTNDFGKQIPIGTNDSTDIQTFKGALNVLIEGLINKYPGKKIFFFTPIQRGDLIDLPIKLIEYVDAMIEICALWGVPCKDMYRGSNLYIRNTFIQNNYFRIDENGESDKLHPNNKGHKIIAEPIEGFIRNN